MGLAGVAPAAGRLSNPLDKAPAGDKSFGLGGGAGLNATEGTEVPILLPNGRQYVIHVPQVDDDRPRPLLIALHGMRLTWQNMAWSSGLSAYADEHGFLVAYGVGVQRSWNIGAGCCEAAARLKVDDVGYLVAMVNDVASRVAVDRSRVYLTGFSTGDSMALYAQCRRPDVFAASAGSSGALLFPCSADSAIRVLHLHGRMDRTVPYAGGFSVILGRRVPPARDLAARLRAQDPAAVVTTRVLPCAHLWPRPDNSCRLDGTDLIWNWLSQFSR